MTGTKESKRAKKPDTPLLSCLQAYADRQAVRFHMPGHKGRLPPPFAEAAVYDVTELPATADLYADSEGPLRRSEGHMAALYGAADCLYLTGGATQGIHSALAALCTPGGSLFVDRLCHMSVYHAMALLDLHPVYLLRDHLEPFGIPGALQKAPAANAKACIYTDPGYYGLLCPPPAIPAGVPRIRDAAHGAPLPFLGLWRTEGDTLTVVSAHKTLSALGQSAFLLSDGTVSHEELRGRARIFGSASPSFLLLASLDLAQARLRQRGKEDWQPVARFHESMAAKHPNILSGRHTTLGIDPAKLCVFTGRGREAAAALEKEMGLVCELSDSRNLLFMLSPQNSAEDFARLENALDSLRSRDIAPLPTPPLPPMAASPREALFGRQKQVPLYKAEGCIAAQTLAATPPGVPLIAPGERFDKITLDFCRVLCYTMDKMVTVLA